MERDDRPPVATFYHGAELAGGAAVTLGEAVAHHARVKRLSANDAVRLTNGIGTLADGRIVAVKRAALEIRLDGVRTVGRPPAIHLRAPVGDRDRMLWLAEKSAELGVTSWQSVHFHRSSSVSPRGEGAPFAAKIRARMVAALEQSGGAWLPEMLREARIDELVQDDRALRIVLDVRGAPLLSLVPLGARREVVVLVGPEGGIEDEELRLLLSHGWRAARLATTTLRFETAGLAAVSVLRAAELEETHG